MNDFPSFPRDCQELRNNDYIGQECPKYAKDPAYMVGGKYGGQADNATIKYCRPEAGQTPHGTGYNPPITQEDYVACPATTIVAPTTNVKVLPHVGSDSSLLLAVVVAIAVAIFVTHINRRNK